MEKVVTLLVIALCGSNAIFIDESASNRIINAQETTIANFPYLVSMQRLTQVAQPTRGHVCGGALITLQHVLTAATCTYDWVNGAYVLVNHAEFRIFGGATLLTDDNDQNRIRTIANITIHPQYVHPPASLNNIAVITLQQPFLNTVVTPIALPATNFAPADFALCQIASWGAPSPDLSASTALRFTSKYVYNQNLCEFLYVQMPLHVNIFSSMICAASFDIISSGCHGLKEQTRWICLLALTHSNYLWIRSFLEKLPRSYTSIKGKPRSYLIDCDNTNLVCSHGDLGTPLVCNGGLAGIMFQTNACAMSSFPEVYTRVSNHTAWIQTISGSSALRPEIHFLGVLAIVIAKFVSKV